MQTRSQEIAGTVYIMSMKRIGDGAHDAGGAEALVLGGAEPHQPPLTMGLTVRR